MLVKFCKKFSPLTKLCQISVLSRKFLTGLYLISFPPTFCILAVIHGHLLQPFHSYPLHLMFPLWVNDSTIHRVGSTSFEVHSKFYEGGSRKLVPFLSRPWKIAKNRGRPNSLFDKTPKRGQRGGILRTRAKRERMGFQCEEDRHELCQASNMYFSKMRNDENEKRC